MSYTAGKWQIGNVTITRVVESESDAMPPSSMFFDLTEADVQKVDWLQPHYASQDGDLYLSFHAFVIESCGRRIIVDTCVGNDKERVAESFHRLNTPFLERLDAAGFPLETIDMVLCTHMHIDHVGWNTRWDGTQWLPTFPNARYLFARREWEFCQQEDRSAGDVPDAVAPMLDARAVIADSVLPVVDRGLADFVESDYRLTSEVSLMPTPGHTPGHVSVLIESEGRSGLITGDAMHHPVQIADPAISVMVDHDLAMARTTRLGLVEQYSDRDAIVLGTHFAAPCGGRIRREASGWRFMPCGED